MVFLSTGTKRGGENLKTQEGAENNPPSAQRKAFSRKRRFSAAFRDSRFFPTETLKHWKAEFLKLANKKGARRRRSLGARGHP
jgi:hypothetical protein